MFYTMWIHILAIVLALIVIRDIFRLLNFGNAGGLGAIISRPVLGLVTTKMLPGLIIWLFELFGGYWALTNIFHWIFG